MGGGCPLPHQSVCAFLEFKISDLVHTLGEFFITNCIYSRLLIKRRTRNIRDGEGVGGSVSGQLLRRTSPT